jgi:hypothetical protein
MEMPNIGWMGGVQLDPEKINCDLTQTEAIFGQEGSESMSVDSTVVQNVLSLFRSIFSNGIYNCPFPLKSSAKSLRYYKKKFHSKKGSQKSLKLLMTSLIESEQRQVYDSCQALC